MLRTLEAATLAATCALMMAPAFAQEAKIPAWDQNDLTVLDRQGNCVLTKWDGTGTECGAAEASALWRTVYFAFDSASLTAESKEKLDRLLVKLNNESDTILRANIVGYADEIGTADYNYKLSQRRAAAVHNYLKGQGYNESNVTEIRALGSRSSAGKCPTTLKRKDRIACLWEDRRVEIELDYVTNAKAHRPARLVR